MPQAARLREKRAPETGLSPHGETLERRGSGATRPLNKGAFARLRMGTAYKVGLRAMTDRRASVKRAATPDAASPLRCRISSSPPAARYVWESSQEPSWGEPGGGGQQRSIAATRGESPSALAATPRKTTPAGLVACVSHAHLAKEQSIGSGSLAGQAACGTRDRQPVKPGWGPASRSRC